MLFDLRTAPPLWDFLNAFLLRPKLLAGESRTFDNESLADTRDPFRDLGKDELLLLPERLLPSLLFLQDCAECGLPGDSPLRLRAAGAGLCLPPGGLGAALFTRGILLGLRLAPSAFLLDSAWSWADSVLLEWSSWRFKGSGLIAFILAVVISVRVIVWSTGVESRAGMMSGDVALFGF